MGVRRQGGDLVPGGDHPGEELLQHSAALHPSARTDVEGDIPAVLEQEKEMRT